MSGKDSKTTEQITQRRVDLEGKGMRILVVDDNPNSAEALAAYIASENIECRIALGGAQAVAVGGDWLPNLIIMDVSMPEINGVQAALLLRNYQKTKGIAMIAFTALDVSEVKRLMTDHEFDGYFQKGQPPADLLALAKHYMS